MIVLRAEENTSGIGSEKRMALSVTRHRDMPGKATCGTYDGEITWKSPRPLTRRQGARKHWKAMRGEMLKADDARVQANRA
jgi:hypothetical protein